MGNRRRQPDPHTDDEILTNTWKMVLLRAISLGQVVRGADGKSTSVNAPWIWNGQAIRLGVRRLRDDELIRMPISGPPTLDVRGSRLLYLADQPFSLDPWLKDEHWSDL